MNPSVVKSGLGVYEGRSHEDHRNVGFLCAAVWSVVVAKVTGAIGYARHESRSRDALIRQPTMRYKNFSAQADFCIGYRVARPAAMVRTNAIIMRVVG